MKQCPQCSRTYADKSIAFCLADGALLSAPYDPDATQRILAQNTPPKVDRAAPIGQDEVADNIHISPLQTTKSKAKTNLLYFVVPAIGLLLFVITGGIYWLSKTTPGYNTNTPPVTKTAPSATSDVPLIPFRKGDKWGFSDVNKTLIINAEYDETEPFSEGRARVRREYTSAYIDKTGRVVSPFKPDGRSYRLIFEFGGLRDNPDDKGNDDLKILQRDDKYGFADRNGNVVIDPQYDRVTSFRDGLAAVQLRGNCGFIDKNGNTVVKFEYDSAHSFSEGLAGVQKNTDGLWGYIDKTGKLVIDFKYKQILWFKDGLAKVARRDGTIFYINKNGTEYYEP